MRNLQYMLVVTVNGRLIYMQKITRRTFIAMSMFDLHSFLAIVKQ